MVTLGSLCTIGEVSEPISITKDRRENGELLTKIEMITITYHMLLCLMEFKIKRIKRRMKRRRLEDSAVGWKEVKMVPAGMVIISSFCS